MSMKLREIKEGPVVVRGWVKSIKKLNRNTFIVLRDGVGLEDQLQVYALSKKCKNLKCESYVEVEGIVRQLPKGNTSFRPFELEAKTIIVYGDSDNDFSNKCPSTAGRDVKMDQRHLYIRDPKFGVVTKLRSILVKSLREHFEESHCTEVFPPHFVDNQCEGGATLFQLDYPDKDKGDIKAYLTQSSQFYLEFALPSVGDCYCIDTSFRAERSHTRRHLTEFLHAESEWHGIMTLEDHLEKLKALVKNTVQKFYQYGKEYLDLLELTPRIETLLSMCDDIVILTHKEAIEYCHKFDIFKDADSKTHFEFTDDIPEMQERQIIDAIGKIVFLVKFPIQFKSFYMQRDPEDPSYVLGCDVEVPGVGEIIGSGIRVFDKQEIEDRLTAENLNVSDYKAYIDLRKYGAGRTSGMGLGVDRFLTWLLDSYSIRDVVTFPRVPGRLSP